MDIWMIWVTDDGETVWLEEAWDDDSTSGNYEGWIEAVKRAEEKFGAGNVRVVKTSIDLDPVLAAFQPIEVAAGRVESVPE